jgi:hypothetical protein
MPVYGKLDIVYSIFFLLPRVRVWGRGERALLSFFVCLFVVAHLFAYSTSEHLLSYSVQFYVWPMA